ncbi:MAG: putative addiction module antidote protein [Gammaproteobacteria bacterium]|nr:putative addiction module antidote protein [Gammaproteobacteria bacterium]
MIDESRSVPYHAADYLQTPKDIAEYLNAAIEDGDEQVLLIALHDIVIALSNMADLLEKNGISEKSLRALSEEENSKIASLFSLFHALDLEIAVRPRQHAA